MQPLLDTSSPEPREQSAAAPSPFPPIADYAFLSNCHTGALVALTAALAGSVSQPSTHPASSELCWTAVPGTFGSDRSG